MVVPTSFSLLSETGSSTDWLVRDLIRPRSLTLFTGARDSGKTILSLLLAQGIATKYVFLTRPCAQFPTAFVSRFEKRLDLYQIASRVSPRLLPTTADQVPVFGCWEPDDIVPKVDDELSETLVLKHYLIFDDIPDPDETENEDPEAFLRQAQHLARRGAGVALFGSSAWEQTRAVKNRTDVRFTIAKSLSRISVTYNTGTTHIDLPAWDSYNFQIAITLA